MILVEENYIPLITIPVLLKKTPCEKVTHILEFDRSININEGDIQFEVYHVNSYTLKDEPQTMSLFAKGRFNIHYGPVTEIKSIKKSNDYNFRNVVKAIHANTQTIIKLHLLNKATK